MTTRTEGPTTIVLTDEMRDGLSNALTNGCPVVAASVDAEDRPKLAFIDPRLIQR
jgi:hypothetical protein